MDARIDILLDLARGELGILQLNRKQIDPLPLLHEVVSEMSPVATRRGISLTLDVPHSLSFIWADNIRLRQVIQNILINALKWTPQGGNITVRARQSDNEMIVEIEDTGPGIAKEKQQSIFEAYYRVENANQHVVGLGLGLALCKTIIESHGGNIWVQSEEGKGSTFGFSVPLNINVN